jgi:hypothetical protein
MPANRFNGHYTPKLLTLENYHKLHAEPTPDSTGTTEMKDVNENENVE